MRHAVIGTVNGQRVLNQVIGADRQKIHLLGKRLRRQGCRRDFYHAADRHGRVKRQSIGHQTGLGLRQRQQSLAQFGHAGEHRNQHAHATKLRGT